MKYIRRLGTLLRQRVHGVVKGHRIAFIHIPKTGGSSIGVAIADSFGVLARVLPNRMVYVNAGASMDAARLGGDELVGYREAVVRYFMQLRQVRYIGGHIPFSPAAKAEPGCDWDFVAVFRHPVKRWISAYYYDRFKESDHAKIDQDIASFLSTDRGRNWGCMYVSLLCGKSIERDVVDQRILDEAIKNLGQFGVVGVLEHMDRFAADYQERFGVKLNIGVTNQNPVKSYEEREEITPELLAEIERVCEPDMAVYQAALQIRKSSA
ncbi:sulfotransferase family 2 domain-containing protein [Mangrovimicrobium sediminis]|nr:sulfotransferase family 2 domain-containing protein [Haliea sp. SAOS-164]